MIVHLLFFCQPTNAQYLLLTNEKHYGVEEGLPQSFISGITQDEDGFIWLGTLDGLCRFDGRKFKTIKFRPNDSSGLAANIITCFGVPENNILPIYYSEMQADNFDMRTFKVSRKKEVESTRHIQNARWDWFGRNRVSYSLLFTTTNDKGMGWIENGTGKVFYANRANGLLQQDTILAMIQSPAGRLYLVSQNGVQVSDRSRTKFRMYAFDTHVKKRPNWFGNRKNVDTYCIAFSSPDNLVILDGNKLILLDIQNSRSRILEIPQRGVTDAVPSELMQVDMNGQPYFTNNGRIFRLQKNGQMKLLWQNQSRPDLRINEMFIDRTDVLWLSVNAQGLLRVDLQAPAFKSYSYKNNFITDILEQAAGRQLNLPKAWADDEAPYYFRQVRDSKGNLYVAGNVRGYSQVFRVEEKGLKALPGLPNRLGHTALISLPGDVIAAFDQDESAWYSWKNPTSLPVKLGLRAASMKDIEVADAAYIGGYTWISTYNHGLLQYDGSKRINRFDGALAGGIMPSTLTEICADPADPGKFWVGSRGGGLILWDVAKGLQRVYTVDDGLPNNTVYCILPGRDGNIWCSTNKGIFRLNPKANKIMGFEKTDGLPGNEFNRAHKFAFADGRICFGGLDGYTIFNPADFDFTDKKQDVPVMLTGLQINNQPQNIDIPGSIIRQSLSTLTTIDLKHDENYLRFEFSAMLFNQPQKTKYRYRLEGADKGWIENGNNNTASYAALPPGKYRLHINATDTYGAWSNVERSIAIRIHPPFWAAWWAYLIYACVLVLAARQYFIFQHKRIKTAQSLAFEKREALRLRETDELKDRFFSNITHEFRTPLTLIISPLEMVLQETTLPAPVVSKLKTAQRNSHQLLRLINEFLDFSKLNDGHVRLKTSMGELELFAATCVQSFATVAAEKNIELQFASHGIIGLYVFDEEKWGKIMANLLSNALKFTPPHGQVSVELNALPDNKVQLIVLDNGSGIAEDQQLKIFDRFYQVDDTSIRSYGGTGIGLALVKELTTIMNGEVTVKSRPGGPTEFVVTVPVQKAGASATELANPVVQKPVTAWPKRSEENSPLLLIVEDDDELRAFLLESMARDYKCIEAANGLAAWDVILQELPDVVISDVMMPGMDGFDLCDRCKTDNRTAHIGFILLTSKTAQTAKLQGLQTGADDYITKPFNTDELALRTANLLHLQQKVRAQLQAQMLPSTPVEATTTIDNPFLQSLYDEIENKIDDPMLGVDYMCKAMGMSRSTLNRKLQSLLGTSPNEVIKHYRLQKATAYLAAGVDVSSAAYKVGFSNPSYFTHCFKEQYHITPSDWVAERKTSKVSG